MHQSPDRTQKARRLRADLTPAERRMWELVRDRRLDDLKFRCEAPLAGLTVDFYCAELGLVVELDGGVHRLRIEDDVERDARLGAAGFPVIRVGNEAFLNNPNDLIAEIRRRAARVRKPPPHPSR